MKMGDSLPKLYSVATIARVQEYVKSVMDQVDNTGIKWELCPVDIVAGTDAVGHAPVRDIQFKTQQRSTVLPLYMMNEEICM